MKDVTHSLQTSLRLCRRMAQLTIAVVFVITGCADCKSSSDCSTGRICVNGKCKFSAKSLTNDTEESEPKDSSTESSTVVDSETKNDIDSESDSESEACVDPETDCPKPGSCEVYTCDDGACALTALNDTTCQSDENECTENICRKGECVATPLSGIACAADENDCTDDVCVSGVCEHVPTSGGACADDGNPCTRDVCDQGKCGTPLSGASCDTDDNPCTSGVCQEGTCDAILMPDATPCDDGIWCNGTADQCESGECVPPIGSEPCDPETPCVNVVCHEPKDGAEGTCEKQLLDDVSCDDGLFCNGDDICDEGVCTHVNPPCDGEIGICEVNVCDDTSDSCSVASVPDGEPCREQDGLLCNGIERCQTGTCTAGSPFCSVFNDCSKNICHEGEDGEEPTCEGVEPDRNHEPCGSTLACDGEGDRYCLDGVCAHGDTPACPDLHQDGNLCTQYVICIEANDAARCIVEKDTTESMFLPIDCDQTVAFDTLTTNNEVTTYSSESCTGSFGGGEIGFSVATPEIDYTATLHVEERTLVSEDLYVMIVTDPCDAANTCIQSSTSSVNSTNGTEEDGSHVIVVDGENGNRGRGTVTLTCP